MKTIALKWTFFAGWLVSAGFACSAGPLRLADVPAEPAWVVHVDCDYLRATDIGQYLLTQFQKPEIQAKLEAFTTIFNFDPRKDLHGFTLYSVGKSPEDGLLLLYADVDPARLEVFARAAKDYKSASHNQHVIHSFIDDKRPAKDGVKPRTYASIVGTKLVVLSQREARVAGALDVLDKTAPNLSGSSGFPNLGAAGGSFAVEAAARKLDLSDSDPNAAVFRLAKLVRLQLGEAQHRLTGRLSLVANDEEVAGHILSVGQGLVSLAKLQQDKPEAARLAEALSIKQQGSEVVATLSLPAGDVVEFMKTKAARKAERENEK